MDHQIKPNYSKEDSNRLRQLKELYRNSFNRLTLDEEKTLEFYYKLGESRGVDGYQYVNEAINRAIMKQNLSKPISYIASLCKNFYKNGLHSQPFQEENDIIDYVEGKIGKLSFDNKKLIQSAISTNGSIRVMAASAEVLNNSEFQSKIIEEIVVRVVEIFGRPNQAH